MSKWFKVILRPVWEERQEITLKVNCKHRSEALKRGRRVAKTLSAFYIVKSVEEA